MSGGTWLFVILWAVYVAECVVRHRKGAIVFRGDRPGHLRPVADPDVELLQGRVGLSWTTAFPWSTVLIAEGTDPDRSAAETRVAEGVCEVFWLRVSAGALFGVLLIVMPVLIMLDRLTYLLPVWAPVLASVWLTTLVLFFRTHRVVFRRRPTFENAASVLLSPLGAIRAPLRVLAELVARSSPLAVASVVCCRSDVAGLLRRVHFDEPELRPEVEALLGSLDLVGEFHCPSAALEPGVVSFCPRCGAAYFAGASECADCPHVALRPSRLRTSHRHAALPRS